MLPMNTIEAYRKEHGLTYDELAALVGINSATVWKHCKLPGRKVSGESAILYHRALGIPLERIRPDLFLSLPEKR
jgi:transcriptional regulator with XRE-family HTH domain